MIDFNTHPDEYHHWKLTIDGDIAWLGLDVDENATIGDGYELKLNSYDLGVDIELNDAIQRLRFEHPGVACVIMHSKKERVFCAGANIRMLAGATHAHKVNFCKFTNETRNSIENASRVSGQKYLCAVQGSCAGGGYELALACDEIWLADDGASTVSLPEVPLLAVLPGTGGLTRLVDKRAVRRDRADFFCTKEEGMRGQRALDWQLVDAIVPTSRFDEALLERAHKVAAEQTKSGALSGVQLKPLKRNLAANALAYEYVQVDIDRELGAATITLKGPDTDSPSDTGDALAEGAAFWPLALLRQLDDAILHLRFNEETIGTWLLKSEGDQSRVLSYDQFLNSNDDHWFIREVLCYAERVFKRLDLSARTLLAAIEPGSCFAGMLMEVVLAADQSYMLLGQFEDDETPAAEIGLTALNFGAFSMVNGISRLESRFINTPEQLEQAQTTVNQMLDAEAAESAGLVTFIPDDIDWEDELRIALESRAGFSADALTGLEANLRFPGPETMESKIFSRLSAWQNWIFQRPNAVGEQGALTLYGSGGLPQFDKRRV